MGRSYLFIPHAPATRLKTRADELARAMAANGHRVDLYQRLGVHGKSKLWEKVAWHLEEMLRGVREELTPDGVTKIFPPALHHSSLLQRGFDQYASYLMQRRGRDVTVSSAFGGPSCPGIGKSGLFLYDYVDDHASGWRHAGQFRLARKVEKFLAREIAAADLVIASSRYQVQEVETRHRRKAIYVPNGAGVEAIRSAPRIREAGPMRFFYMGGLDYFVHLEWPLEALASLRDEGHELELWVAGEGPSIRGKSFPSWVKLLGFRPPGEIPSLLKKVDFGILPFELNPFTDAALPLKILEYGAARLPTISSPLSELKIQRFPWVRFAGSDQSQWRRALADAMDEKVAAEDQDPWDPAWDKVVDSFSWRTIAAGLDHAIAQPGSRDER